MSAIQRLIAKYTFLQVLSNNERYYIRGEADKAKKYTTKEAIFSEADNIINILTHADILQRMKYFNQVNILEPGDKIDSYTKQLKKAAEILDGKPSKATYKIAIKELLSEKKVYRTADGQYRYRIITDSVQEYREMQQYPLMAGAQYVKISKKAYSYMRYIPIPVPYAEEMVDILNKICNKKRLDIYCTAMKDVLVVLAHESEIIIKDEMDDLEWEIVHLQIEKETIEKELELEKSKINKVVNAYAMRVMDEFERELKVMKTELEVDALIDQLVTSEKEEELEGVRNFLKQEEEFYQQLLEKMVEEERQRLEMAAPKIQEKKAQLEEKEKELSKKQNEQIGKSPEEWIFEILRDLEFNVI